jgi:Zn-dependent protease
MQDAQPKAKTDVVLHTALLLLAVALGAVLQVAGPPWVQAIFQKVDFSSAGSASAILLALAAAVMMHEGGHFLMAWACDFEILGGKLGPLRLERLHGMRKISVSWRGLFSCSVAAVPRSCAHWRGRMMLVVAAGPAATLIGFVSAVRMATSSDPGNWAGVFWSALTLFHFFLFVLGLIPNSESARIRNDARLFLALQRDGAAARELNLYHRLIQLRLAAVRPYDYPASLLSQELESPGRPEAKLLIARTLTEWSLDSDDVTAADAWDRRALEQGERCDGRLRNSALAASGCFDVLFRGDIAAAHEKLRKVDFEALFPKHFAHRANAAWLLANGRLSEVPAQVLRAQYALPLGLPYYDFERMLLGKLHLKALGVSDDTLVSAAAR